MGVNVPRELEDEILSRVPEKSLARFRSVCKQWNTQLVDETFLEQHSSRMDYNYDDYGDQHRIIINNACSRLSSLDMVGPSSASINDISLINRKYPHEMRKRIKVYKIVHCTGLLLCVMDNQLLVWNPMLKETRWVKCGSDFHCFDDAYGLGFVRQSPPPTHRSYKIVRFRCARNDRDRPPRVEVYEFAYNSWKVIADITFDWHLKLPLSNVSLGGNPYWIGLRQNDAFIQSFDFSKERFQPLDQQLPFGYNEHNPIALEAFRGNKLSLLEQCHLTRKISIWVRHLITPWTILMVVTIPHFPMLHQPPPPQVKIRAWLYRSRFSISYFVDRNDETLVVSVFDVGPRSVSIYRVREKEFQRVFVDTAGNSCSYVPSLAHPHGSSMQDTTRIRYRKNRFN
uniref:F-box domain-containing protein n=1 Tax=Brassica campestris TaxID=3711 RepID=M4CR74_BRACM